MDNGHVEDPFKEPIIVSGCRIPRPKEIKQFLTQEINLAAPCGIYCGFCPSYQKGTCFGCKSKDRTQKRITKWRCKIRQCCFEKNGFDFCNQCSDFPCVDRRKLDQRYSCKYNVSLIDNLLRIKKIGTKQWLKEQANKWRCPGCGGNICVHERECHDCGYKINQS